MKSRILIFLLAIASLGFMNSCTQANRQNSLGKEDSVRNVPPPDTSRNRLNSDLNDLPNDNTATEATDTVVPKP